MSVPQGSAIRSDIHEIEDRAVDAMAKQDPDWAQFEPTLRTAIYALSSFAFVIALSMATTRSDSHTILILNYSHLSIPVLAIGLAVFPVRLTWLSFCVFFISFLLVELVTVGFEKATGWTAFGIVKALPVALAVGFAAGTAAKSFSLTSRTVAKVSRSPERAALVAGLVVALVGIPLGCLGLWADSHGKLDSEEYMNLAIVLSQRVLRLAIITSAATLMLGALPSRRELPEFAIQTSAFVLLAIANKFGLALISYTDPAVLGAALIVLRPIRPTLAAILTGICIFTSITGTYVELPSIVSFNNLRHEQVANLLFIILLLVAAMRIKSERMEKAQLRTLGRMARVQELARYGHYIIDPTSEIIRFDALIQRNLNVSSELHSFEFLQRVHPDDKDDVVKGCLNMPEGEATFSFRLSKDGAWEPNCEFRHVAGFAVSETLKGVPELTYGVLLDVTREHLKEEEMLNLVNELSERQGQQTQLFSIISHELRTPASILSLLLDEMDDSKDWATAGPKMRGVLDQLLSILSDMRQTVRPEQNLPIRIEAFQPSSLAKSVTEAFQPLAEAQGILLRFEIGKDADAYRSTDKVRLNQTLSNLIKNAIVHSQATEVLLKFTCETDDIGVWTVSDNGRNISKEQREGLFQPFVRSNTEGVRSDGSGLGLYIAKGAIELLGGTITFENRPMSGAAFSIRLPMPRVMSPNHETRDEYSERKIDPSTVVVLLLEDSETMGEILSTRLSRVFKSVKWLRDGAAGLDWLSKNDVDVVVTDLYMPGMSGTEIAEKLRSKGFVKPIIGMTAAESGTDVEKFRASGADAVLTKPIGPKDLLAAIADIEEPG